MANKNVFNTSNGLCGKVPDTGSNSSPSRNRPVVWVVLVLSPAPNLANPSPHQVAVGNNPGLESTSAGFRYS